MVTNVVLRSPRVKALTEKALGNNLSRNMTRKYVLFNIVFALVFVSVQGKDIGNDKTRDDSLTRYLENFPKYARMLESSEEVVKTSNKIKGTNIEKRDQSPPSSFEDIERNYLIAQCTKNLQIFIGFAQKANNNTETRAHLEQVLQDEIVKLNHMNVTDLKQYLARIQHAVHHGNHGNLVITGHSSSVTQVSEWVGNIVGG